jgi:hypothetical protein
MGKVIAYNVTSVSSIARRWRLEKQPTDLRRYRNADSEAQGAICSLDVREDCQVKDLMIGPTRAGSWSQDTRQMVRRC